MSFQEEHDNAVLLLEDLTDEERRKFTGFEDWLTCRIRTLDLLLQLESKRRNWTRIPWSRFQGGGKMKLNLLLPGDQFRFTQEVNRCVLFEVVEVTPGYIKTKVIEGRFGYTNIHCFGGDFEVERTFAKPQQLSFL